jgi:periplasmic divalent cation tolerance protein
MVVSRAMAYAVLTTVPDRKTASSLARMLVKKKLAACVSFQSGFTSMYRWNGKIVQTNEAILIIKILPRNFRKVAKALKSQHPYKLPEIVAFPIDAATQEYLSWLKITAS